MTVPNVECAGYILFIILTATSWTTTTSTAIIEPLREQPDKAQCSWMEEESGIDIVRSNSA